MDKDIYNKAMKLALKVDFIQSIDELFLYADAVYSAIMWGNKVNNENSEIHKKRKYLK